MCVYVCVIIVLTLTPPPSLSLVDPSPEISIITPVNYNDEYLANSESVTVKCSDMEGIPTAIFTWFIDDTPVALTTLTVNITTGDRLESHL